MIATYSGGGSASVFLKDRFQVFNAADYDDDQRSNAADEEQHLEKYHCAMDDRRH